MCTGNHVTVTASHLTNLPTAGVLAVNPKVLSTLSMHDVFRLVALHNPSFEQIAPAFFPRLMLFVVMLSAKLLQSATERPSVDIEALHQDNTAAATTAGSVAKRSAPVTLVPALRQLLQIVQGVLQQSLDVHCAPVQTIVSAFLDKPPGHAVV